MKWTINHFETFIVLMSHEISKKNLNKCSVIKSSVYYIQEYDMGLLEIRVKLFFVGYYLNI